MNWFVAGWMLLQEVWGKVERTDGAEARLRCGVDQPSPAIGLGRAMGLPRFALCGFQVQEGTTGMALAHS